MLLSRYSEVLVSGTDAREEAEDILGINTLIQRIWLAQSGPEILPRCLKYQRVAMQPGFQCLNCWQTSTQWLDGNAKIKNKSSA